MTRVKVCGITRPEDAVAAVRVGASAVGLVFAPSPRRVSVGQAREIVASLPPFVTSVGVFVDSSAEAIIECANAVGLSAVQLHGDEEPSYLESLTGVSVIKAVRVRDKLFLGSELTAAWPVLLLDAYVEGVPGGTGQRVPLDVAREAVASGKTVILAGGLDPDNVESAIRSVRPYAVDVSSGVESEPGRKDHVRLARFLDAVRRADWELDQMRWGCDASV